ncbi:hypothetical protein AX17_004678 [Amanita inopinata Kibby_2008]|nr:hypothetical protein AX17_004678 [Amanita inopinata Kibby_2008]
MNIYVSKEAIIRLKDTTTFITTWLERSRTLPLTIHLKIPKFFSVSLNNTIFKSLYEHASRWESVFIQQPYSLYVPTPTVELPLLQSFKFDYERCSPRGEWSLPFTSAPRLTCLHWPHPPPVIGHPSVPWHQLRNVQFTYRILAPHTVVEILQNCPELLELEVNVDEEDSSEGSFIPCKPRILHRQLHRLDISIWETCGSLLDSLTLPGLRDLSLSIHIRFFDDIAEVRPIQEQLLHLLSRSECALDKLALPRCRFDTSMLQECFRHKSLTMLTELKFESYDYHIPTFADNAFNDLTCIPSPGCGMLLPKLSSLSLRYCLSGTPGLLGRMILSRCPGPEKEGDRLKYFFLIDDHLNVEDEECIDEARLRGLTAEILITD